MTIEQFWNDYWVCINEQAPSLPEAFQFGADANWLAQLVVDGKKTATCSGHIFYELENERLPSVGQYNIVLNAENEPVAIIQITSVELSPMNEVPESFALAEGEGDYEDWWNAHVDFFTKALTEYKMTFSDTMMLVCERFDVLHTIKD